MSRGVNARDRSSWEERGGRVRFDAKGRPVYVIRKQMNGRRFEVSTRKHTLAAALAEWERFEKDPDGYAPGGGTAPLHLDNDLAREFLAFSKNERRNTVQWVSKQKATLAWWMERLAGVNLRRASLRDHILTKLEGAPGRRHKIVVIKALFSWLRKVRHLITSGEDCTLDLTVPQMPPEQLRRSKVVPREHVFLVIEGVDAKGDRVLDEPWRDALLLQAGTGWHTTEVVRFAATGTIETLPRNVLATPSCSGVLVCPMHKSGEPIRTRVSPPVLEAAKRLRAHGPISREWYDRAVRAACAAVKRPEAETCPCGERHDGQIGVPVFTPGRLRHSVATWAINAGADPASVAAFLGHKSSRTTRKFYATHASPTKVPTLA
jgi:integrase